MSEQKFVIAYHDDEDGWLRFDDSSSNLCVNLEDAYEKAAVKIEAEFKAKSIKCDRTRKPENILVAGGVDYKVYLDGDPSVPAA
jgi:hypothetical protein